jgi:hypothetical protein
MIRFLDPGGKMKSPIIFFQTIVLLGLAFSNAPVYAQTPRGALQKQPAFGARDLEQGPKITFRKEGAAWLYDLVQNPTRTENFFLIADGGNKIACINKFLDPGILCTINGTTEVPPTSSKEGYTFCTISKDRIVRINLADQFNLFEIQGDSSKVLYGLLPNEYPPTEWDGYNVKSKYIGKPFSGAGISCEEYSSIQVPSDVFYRCTFTETK